MTGFSDVAPVVREQTVKAVLTVVTKLSDRTINGDLLKHLAKTANDEQPGIRTNTTICLGKLARSLGANVSFCPFPSLSSVTKSVIDSTESPHCRLYTFFERSIRSRKKCCVVSSGGDIRPIQR